MQRSIILLFTVFFLAGCAGAEPALILSTATATLTASPTVTLTPTDLPTVTLTPTATAIRTPPALPGLFFEDHLSCRYWQVFAM